MESYGNKIGKDCWDIILDYKIQLEHVEKFKKTLIIIDRKTMFIECNKFAKKYQINGFMNSMDIEMRLQRALRNGGVRSWKMQMQLFNDNGSNPYDTYDTYGREEVEEILEEMYYPNADYDESDDEESDIEDSDDEDMGFDDGELRNFLEEGFHIGGESRRSQLGGANLQLRPEPPTSQRPVSIWHNSTIEDNEEEDILTRLERNAGLFRRRRGSVGNLIDRIK